HRERRRAGEREDGVRAVVAVRDREAAERESVLAYVLALLTAQGAHDRVAVDEAFDREQELGVDAAVDLALVGEWRDGEGARADGERAGDVGDLVVRELRARSGHGARGLDLVLAGVGPCRRARAGEGHRDDGLALEEPGGGEGGGVEDRLISVDLGRVLSGDGYGEGAMAAVRSGSTRT